MKYDLYKGHTRVKITKLPKIYYPTCWHYFSYSTRSNIIKKSVNSPNLFVINEGNSLGNNGKSSIYIAIPQDADNIRVTRGNGIINCGTYKFIYSERYVKEEERMVVEGSFNLQQERTFLVLSK